MRDHAEVRELLELAAVERDGLERLAAGDTPEAAAIAGHLAGCPAGAEEARRLAVVGQLVREAVQTVPPVELRARTLDLVREVGRPRRAVATAPVPASTADPGAAARERPAGSPSPAGSSSPAVGGRARRVLGWPAALAAVLVVALVGGGLLSARLIDDQRAHAAALAALNVATLRIGAEPDALLVSLVGAAAGAGAPTGTLLFSATTEELVVTATGLREPPAGQVFACWVVRADGSRARMGTMDFGGGLAYWDGWSDDLKGAGPGTTFGVTLVDAAGHPVEPGDVLAGTAEQG
ncbi:MAG: anti-sigma factor [Candidatus Limnocylindrales bacterium]